MTHKWGMVVVGDLFWDLDGVFVTEQGELKYELAQMTFMDVSLEICLYAARGLRKAFPDREVVVIGYDRDSKMFVYDDNGLVIREWIQPTKNYAKCEYRRKPDDLVHYFNEAGEEIGTAPFVRIRQA